MTLSVLDAAALPVTLATLTAPGDVEMSRTQPEAGQYSALNITTATVVKSSAGRSFRVCVLTAGSTAGALHDCATTGAVAAANKVATIPNTVGVYHIDFPHAAGITLAPGTSQALSISYT